MIGKQSVRQRSLNCPIFNHASMDFHVATAKNHIQASGVNIGTKRIRLIYLSPFKRQSIDDRRFQLAHLSFPCFVLSIWFIVDQWLSFSYDRQIYKHYYHCLSVSLSTRLRILPPLRLVNSRIPPTDLMKLSRSLKWAVISRQTYDIDYIRAISSQIIM